jgi:SHS2 domain-containing protein
VTTEEEKDKQPHDLLSLLYAFMDEFLFRFATDEFVPKRIKILSLDRTNFNIQVKAYVINLPPFPFLRSC